MDETPKHSTGAQRWDGFLTEAVRPLTDAELQSFSQQCILITGAGGFIGSALAQALSQVSVRRLVLLDIAEHGLYQLEQELRVAETVTEIVLVVGTVRDEALLRELFAEHAPEVVFHAAALKHVPLMESNMLAAAETNVLGTNALVAAVAKYKAARFVHVSTDKAVEPISIMGATKRIAENIVLSARAEQVHFNAVRLCNVLGSTGSVAPLFADQIARGDPVTVTHPDVTRYFISRADAVRYLLRSAITKTQTGLIVPVVAKAQRIEDLAKYMIRQAPQGSGSVGFVYTGLRIADKLHEQLMSRSEASTVQNERFQFVEVRTQVDVRSLERALSEIREAVSTRDRGRLLQAIHQAVPEYLNPQELFSRNVKEGA